MLLLLLLLLLAAARPKSTCIAYTALFKITC